MSKSNRIRFRASALLAIFASVAVVHADVRLPALFTDHMVLQQGRKVPVWGWADEGESVTVEFRGQRVATVAKGGKWMVHLRPLSVGAAEPLKVQGKNRIEIADVLVGEVWVCSGQSNMQWPMTQSFKPEQDIANSANPSIRLFYVPRTKSQTPASDVAARWEECGPKSVAGFSAVAYYFGRDLQKALNVPVGLIHTSWGGSPAEVWIRDEVLQANPTYGKDIVESGKAGWQKHEEALAKYRKDQEELKRSGKTAEGRPPNAPWRPSELYNGMIAPLLPYAIQGAIWYQGESNAGRAHQYRTLYPDMIQNWRSDWNQGAFTFLGVQLAPWDRNKRRSLDEITAAPGESDWAELREAQVLSTKVLPKVGLAVITDVGDKDDIHPAKKEPVGARLALAARRIAYGQKVVHSGPAYRGSRVRDGKMILRFDHVGRGLESRDGDLKGFSICGADQKFVWADARIEGATVVVSRSQVSDPIAVRYGWSDFPVVNLFNKDGLPASPFRTDDFRLTTAPK